MTKAEFFGCLPLCKDLIDVIANFERVIGNFSEYDQPDQAGQTMQVGIGFPEMVNTGIATEGVNPVTGFSFALALFAVASMKRSPRLR